MQKRYVWAAVIVRDGVAEAAEYRGKIDADVFEAITSNILAAGWFRMDEIVWDRDRQDVVQARAGAAWGYSGTSYFRVEWISRIIPLTPESVQRYEQMGTFK